MRFIKVKEKVVEEFMHLLINFGKARVSKTRVMFYIKQNVFEMTVESPPQHVATGTMDAILNAMKCNYIECLHIRSLWTDNELIVYMDDLTGDENITNLATEVEALAG